jgi:predicted PurR-regulated permease PerM
VARGVIGIAILQALLIGVGLIVAGVPHAGLLTLAALVLAIVQVGTVPVVAPLVIWYWLTREPSSAVLFTLYMGPAAVIDSVLKPLVMGQGLQTPMLVIIVGVLGGTVAYGLPGLFLGPIIMALVYELVGYWLQGETPTPETDATGSEEPGS